MQEKACLDVGDKLRYLWVSGSLLWIFTFKNAWYIGEITDIYIDDITKEEWFIVKYNENKNQLQRLCTDIKPIAFESKNISNFELYVTGWNHRSQLAAYSNCQRKLTLFKSNTEEEICKVFPGKQQIIYAVKI